MKRKPFPFWAMAPLLGIPLVGMFPPPRKPKEITEADLSRIRAAEEKRERKAARKANQRAAKGEV